MNAQIQSSSGSPQPTATVQCRVALMSSERNKIFAYKKLLMISYYLVFQLDLPDTSSNHGKTRRPHTTIAALRCKYLAKE